MWIHSIVPRPLLFYEDYFKYKDIFQIEKKKLHLTSHGQ